MRETQNLNGEWRLILDPADEGLKEKWFQDVPADCLNVTVPSVWDRWAPDYDGVGWYYRTFEMPDHWQDRHVDLRFEAADYEARVWLNGAEIGGHEGGYTPFTLDATQAVRPGGNLMAVRIVDPHGPKGYGDIQPTQIACAKENAYWSYAGIWGDVSLTAKSPAHITDVFIQPDLRRKRVTATIDTSREVMLRLSILNTPHQVEGSPGKLLLDFADFETWSPDCPTLYTLRCEAIVNDETVDRVDTRFGMREFTVRDNRFYLNNRPIYIRAALLQPDYPESLAAPRSEGVARRELELAKQAGFNMIRAHVRPAPPVTLDLCDELGLLVYEETAIGTMAQSRQLQDRCEREVREMILRDRNHPSVVMWGILDEAGGMAPGVPSGPAAIKEDLAQLAHSLDPSRVVIDDSGGAPRTGQPTRHIRAYHHELEPHDDFHICRRAPVDKDIEAYYRHHGSPDRLFFLSELGFGGMEDLESVLEQYGDDGEFAKDAKALGRIVGVIRDGFEDRNLDRTFGSLAQFAKATQQIQCIAAARQIDAVRANENCAGYVYRQLADAGRDFSGGVMDRWRRPKAVLKTLQDTQLALRPIIHISKTNLHPREEADIRITLINDEREEGQADLSLQVVGPTNQVLWKKKRGVTISKARREIWSGKIAASGSTGPHKFVVRLIRGMKVATQASVNLHVMPPVTPSDVQAAVVDPERKWRRTIGRLCKPGKLDAPVHIVPSFGNTIQGYPAGEMAAMLAQVYEGAVAILFEPPDDWNDLAERLEKAVTATARDATGGAAGAYHYVKLHPVFENLPSRCLMGTDYQNIVPAKTFAEASDEDICGAFDTRPLTAPTIDEAAHRIWGSDILVRRFGSGRLVFTHLRILENLGEDPAADHLFVNMINHFARRSVPSEEAVPPLQEVYKWLESAQRNVRRWLVLGMFPNAQGEGHDTAYPPETHIDLDVLYKGWYRAIEWRTWYSAVRDKHRMDLQQACSLASQPEPNADYGTAYCFAEFVSERRQDVTLNFGAQHPTKAWLNGELVFATDQTAPPGKLPNHSVESVIRLGKNSILIKTSKSPGECVASFDMESRTDLPLAIKRWN